jgi:hypothetical protein
LASPKLRQVTKERDGGEGEGGGPLSDEVDGLVSGDGKLSDASLLGIPVPELRAVIRPSRRSEGEGGVVKGDREKGAGRGDLSGEHEYSNSPKEESSPAP